MQYRAYIKNLAGDTTAVIDDCYNVDIDMQLSGICSASFSMFYDNQYASKQYLKRLSPIELYSVDGSIETLLFDGIIKGIDATIEEIKIILNDWNYLLSRRILMQDYTFNQSLASIVQKIRDDINSTHSLGLTLEISDMEEIVQKEFSSGISFLYVLQELLNDGYEWKIQYKTLKVGKDVGEDRTSGPEYREFSYLRDNADNSNIYEITTTDDGDQLSNGVLYKGKESFDYKKDEVSIDEYGLWENSITEGSNANEYLDIHKNGVEEFTISISDEDFTDIGLGDEVMVIIDGGSDIMQYHGGMRIIGKRFGGEEFIKVEYTISTDKVEKKNFINKQKELEDRIKKIELS